MLDATTADKPSKATLAFYVVNQRREAFCEVAALIVRGALGCDLAKGVSSPRGFLERVKTAAASRGAPGWDRTSNPCLRRAVLYPLSYGRDCKL